MQLQDLGERAVCLDMLATGVGIRARRLCVHSCRLPVVKATDKVHGEQETQPLQHLPAHSSPLRRQHGKSAKDALPPRRRHRRPAATLTECSARPARPASACSRPG